MLRSVPYVKLCKKALVPVRASDEAVGYDVFACRELDRQTKEVVGPLPVVIAPGGARLIGIGIAFAITPGYEAQVRPRSGLASKSDLELSNSPGTVDPDFRGETGVLLRNRGDQPFTVEPEMRIAQLVFSSVETPDLVELKNVNELPKTRRGTGGFGFTGLFGPGVGTTNFDNEVRRFDIYFMNIVLATAALSNCARGCTKDEAGKYKRSEEGQLIGQTRRYGCVIANGLRIIASGFNCQYPGSELCAEVGCLREAQGIPSGQQIEICRAVHAEQMAIDSAANTGASVKGATIYVNAEPCLFCARQIAGLEIEALVVLKGGYGETHGLNTIRQAGIKVREITL